MEAGELRHQIALGRPDVAEVAGAVRHGAVGVPSIVMGRALLGGHVVGVEADVVLPDVEGHGCLTGREAPDGGNPQLDDEPPARDEVARRVAEAGDLLLLSAQVPDAVPDQVHQRELPGHRGGRHVADDDGDVAALAVQLIDHRLRQLDAGHRDATSVQRDGDAPGADRQLERRPVAGELGEEVDDRVDHVGGCKAPVALVVPHRNVGSEVVLHQPLRLSFPCLFAYSSPRRNTHRPSGMEIAPISTSGPISSPSSMTPSPSRMAARIPSSAYVAGEIVESHCIHPGRTSTG